MNHPLRCRCGALQGQVTHNPRAQRGVCYCKDCQAFAHFLGNPDEILDRFGGTEVLATQPRFVMFTVGLEYLACMSLSPKGTLRWYASCCNTPIGNNVRDIRTAHIGLIHNCVEDSARSLEAMYGPIRMHVNRKSALGTPPSAPVSTFFAILHFVRSLIGARLSGSYRQNPFFQADHVTPLVAPRVLTLKERQRLSR
jgi:hypothetical protein